MKRRKPVSRLPNQACTDTTRLHMTKLPSLFGGCIVRSQRTTPDTFLEVLRKLRMTLECTPQQCFVKQATRLHDVTVHVNATAVMPSRI
jgi:hypothetical protein